MRYPKQEKKYKNKKQKECVKCGSKNVVNNTHSLCHEHNQERLHGANWKQDKIRVSKKLSQSSDNLLRSKPKVSKKPLKRASERQNKINSELVKTYALIKETRDPACESCGKWHTQVMLSNSHTISVARCKQLGKPELITDENNIVLECFEAPSSYPKACHNIWENGTIGQKMNLKTFEHKLAYIKEYDPENYKKFLIEIESI